MHKVQLTWDNKYEALSEALYPCDKTLLEDREKSVEWDTTRNIFIEGDNLDALKILQEEYRSKVKMIYIDPPYNTGKKMQYKDKFTHAEWLNMMHPRLVLARELLKEDGVIFISIDDNEQARLKLLCDEVFGEENFVNNIIWQRKYAPVNISVKMSDTHDFIVCCAKNKNEWKPGLLARTEAQNKLYKNLDNDPRGVWMSGNLLVCMHNKSGNFEITTPSGRKVKPPKGTSWRVSQERLAELIADNRIWFGKDGSSVPRIKRFLSEVKDGVTPKTLWEYKEVGHTQDAKREIKKFFDDSDYPLFGTPKPTKLLKRILQIGSSKDSLVMDFFAGSGSFADAVMQLNAEDGGTRKHICVELYEPANAKSYTIADICRERIRRAGKKIKEEYTESSADIGFKAFRVGSL